MPDLEEHDESVRIAVKALGDMKNGTPRNEGATTSESGPSSPFMARVSHIPLVNSAIHLYEQGKASSSVVKFGAQMMESSVRTISRPVIHHLPVNVNQLDEFACKQLDRLDRYRRPSTSNAESQNTITTSSPPPIFSEDQTPGSPPPPSPSSRPPSNQDPNDHVHDQISGEEVVVGGKTRTWKGKGKNWLQASSPFVGCAPAPPPDLEPMASSSTSGTQHSSPAAGTAMTEEGERERQVAQRSRWQAVLLEAGGLSAALSEESMRRLKYCLQWLQYATAHIDAQILILRDFTASLQPLPPSSSTSTSTTSPSSDSSSSHRQRTISQAHLRTLTTIRQDIVQTVKEVVDVVSRYAGYGALPEPARSRVRGFVLALPQRWAQKTQNTGGKGGVGSGSSSVVEDAGQRERERDGRESVVTAAAAAGGAGVGAVRRGNRRHQTRERGPGGSTSVSGVTPASSRAASPMTRHSGAGVGGSAGDGGSGSGGDAPVSAGTAILTAQRILTLATESLDMMRGVTGVVKDSLDRADAWVGRLRTVGIQQHRGRAGDEDDGSNQEGEEDPNNQQRTQTQHSRRTSSGSHFDDEYYGGAGAGAGGMPSPYSGTTSLSSPSSFSYSLGSGGPASSSSSVPSTPGPGTGTHTPVHVGYGQGYYPFSGGSGVKSNSNPLASPNLMGLGLGSMTLDGEGEGEGVSLSSLYGTPMSTPEDGEDDTPRDDLEDGDIMNARSKMKAERTVEVKNVGMDVEGEEGGGRKASDDDHKGVVKMDVDV